MLNQRLAMLLIMLAALGLMYVKGRRPVSVTRVTPLSASDTSSVVIQVSGNVAHGGIYRLTDKKMTSGVINMIAPLCESGSFDRYGLDSVVLASGDLILFDCKNNKKQTVVLECAVPAAQMLTLGLKIDLNRASREDLELVPGIGAVLAQRIYDHRHKYGDFTALDQLLQVEGIGKKKLSTFCLYLKVLK